LEDVSHEIHNTHEVGLLHSYLPDKTLTFKDQSCLLRERRAKHMLTVLLWVNIDGSDKQALIMVGKSLYPIVLETNIFVKYYTG
jgi:hypothetical protein